MGIIRVQWRDHQCEVGAGTGTPGCRVGLFRRMLPVNISPSNTTYLSHKLSAVNMNAQFYIYFISRKTFLNKPSLNVI